LRLLPEEFRRQMVGCAKAGVGKAHLAGVGAQFGDHLRHGTRRFARRSHQDVGGLDRDSDVVKLIRDMSPQPLHIRWRDVLEEHRRIDTAIARGDVEAARQAMTDHLRGGMMRLFGRDGLENLYAM